MREVTHRFFRWSSKAPSGKADLVYGEDEHILVVLYGDIDRNEERVLLRVGPSVAKHWFRDRAIS